MEFVPSREKVKQEQFPLLNVEGGDGDAETTPRANPNATAPVARVVAPRDRSFSNWWPELVSVCWITLLVFIVGLVAFMIAGCYSDENKRRIKPISVECLSNYPQVYYYQIIRRDHKIQFQLYSEYLSMMAAMYPHLCFNVYFLEDDATRRITRGQRNNGLYNRLYQNDPPSWVTKLGIAGLTALNTMLVKNPNVNVTIVPLSCFMEKTQLKNIWKSVPLDNLAFYIKVHTVWKLGGIALDLATYRNKYIMQSYNREIMDVFAKINNDASCRKRYDKDNFSSIKNEILEQLWFSNKTYVNADTGKARDPDDALLRTQRNKREIPIVELDVVQVDDNNILLDDADTQNLNKSNETEVNDEALKEVNPTTFTMPKEEKKTPANSLSNKSEPANKTSNATVNQPKLKYYYDILTIYAGPPVSTVAEDYFRLIIDRDGSFIATACLEQPFLGQILASNFIRINPTVLIQSLYLDICSDNMFGNVWCGPVRFI